MISYYKYTTGEAFTLNGDDYTGSFHILSGVAYTGQYSSIDSLELTPKDTFLSDIYVNELNLDTTYKGIDNLGVNYSNVFDIFNKQESDTLFLSMDNNNLLCYKNLILANPTVYNFEENSGGFYTLPFSGTVSNTQLPRNTNFVGHIDPFSKNINWKFLDNITTGVLFVDTYENFKYICSDGAKEYVLAGNFVTNIPLTLTYIKDNIGSSPQSYTYSMTKDEVNSRILIVKNDFIEVYDASNYADCDKLLLIDRIPLKPTDINNNIWNTTKYKFNSPNIKFNDYYTIVNSNNPEYIKFGRNLRTYIQNNVLYLINKYSSEIYQSIDMIKYNLQDIIDIDIRTADDFVMILHDIDNKLQLTTFDPQLLDATIKTQSIFSTTQPSESYKIKFSEVDSNMFVLYSDKEYQTRYFSKPEYPSGRLETCDLFYPENTKWNNTFQQYRYFPMKWNSAKLKSNSYNNINAVECVANNKQYMIAHNIGRIYALNQPMPQRYLNALPLDLVKNFTGTTCNKSSLGLYFNSALSNIIRDTLDMFAKSTNSFELSEREVIYKQLQSVILDSVNLYMNGNETFNVIVLQRTISTITNIQKNLLPTEK